MPKREQYEADGGFVEDAPKSKKRRSAGNELKSTEGKSTVNTDMQKDQEGNEYWEVREFEMFASTIPASAYIA